MKSWLIGIVACCGVVAGLGFSLSRQADFETLDGQTYQWQQLRGQWLVINYFARWCAPCLREIPELNQFYREHPEVGLFAVSFDALTPEQLASLKHDFQIHFPLMSKIEHALWPKAPATLPHTIIINPLGQVVAELQGEQTAESLQRTLSQLEEQLQLQGS